MQERGREKKGNKEIRKDKENNTHSPYYSTGDQEDCSSKQEAEALHEGQCGCVEPVKEAIGHKVT